MRAGDEAVDVLQGFLQRARQPGRVLVHPHALRDYLARGEGGLVVTINLYDLHHYVRSVDYRRYVDSAGAWTADGWPIVRALHGAGVTVSRVTGSGLCVSLLESKPEGDLRRVAVLGASAAVLDEFDRALSRVGRELVHGDPGHRDSWMAETSGAALHHAQPDIVLVAVGSPYAVPIAGRVTEWVSCPVVPVGAGVGMATGFERRAPQAIQNVHLEWAYRMAFDPQRLWRRYLVECLPVLPPLATAVWRTPASPVPA